MDSVHALWTHHEALGSKRAFIFKTEGGKKGKISQIYDILSTKQHCYMDILSKFLDLT